MKPNPRSRTISSRQPRAIGRKRPEQPGAAVQEDGEDRAADDQQQRLAEDHSRRRSPAPSPNHTAAFCNSRRTSGSRNSAGPGRSTWGSVVAGRSPSDVCRSDGRRGHAEGPSARSAGSTRRCVPSSEKVMNSARPPRFSQGTGPPRPPPSRARGCRRCRRDYRPSARRDRRESSPARNRLRSNGQARRCRRCGRSEGFRGRPARGSTSCRPGPGHENRRAPDHGPSRRASWRRSAPCPALPRRFTGWPLMKSWPSTIRKVSPGRPITRLI